jgi:hypothetical protein
MKAPLLALFASCTVLAACNRAEAPAASSETPASAPASGTDSATPASQPGITPTTPTPGVPPPPIDDKRPTDAGPVGGTPP